jgi:hypothetical protein
MNTNVRTRSGSKRSSAPAAPSLLRVPRDVTSGQAEPLSATPALAHSFNDVRVHDGDQRSGESPVRSQTPAVAGRLDRKEGKDSSEGPGEAAPATEAVAGTLWAQSADGKTLPPSLDDISQGGVGDCYLFASMAAIVKANPQKIVDMIRDNKDGTYTVTFEGIGFFSSAEQTVSATLPKGKHGNVTARKALWPLIVEAAYGKEKGGLETGRNPGDVMQEMLDEGPARFDPREKTVDYIMGKIVTGIDKKFPMTIHSPKKEGASTEKKALADGTPGLVFNHAYAIVGVDAKTNRIKLFNPWGWNHPNGDGWIDVEKARQFFAEVNING